MLDWPTTPWRKLLAAANGGEEDDGEEDNGAEAAVTSTLSTTANEGCRAVWMKGDDTLRLEPSLVMDAASVLSLVEVADVAAGVEGAVTVP